MHLTTADRQLFATFFLKKRFFVPGIVIRIQSGILSVDCFRKLWHNLDKFLALLYSHYLLVSHEIGYERNAALQELFKRRKR